MDSRRPIVALVAALSLGTLRAAAPPDLVNYQGVLRGADDAPLSGTYDMTFRFWNATTAGNEILVDTHAAAGSGAVTVTGGLFNVLLGGGTIADGSGPGVYAALHEVFRDHASVWLEIQIGAEVLSPRVRVAASPYAQNAMHLGGKASGQFLDTSAAAQGKLGTLVGGQAAGTGLAYGLEGYGVYGGGFFGDVDGSGQAYLARGDFGVEGFGNVAGAYFQDSDSSGVAWLGYGDLGIQALGASMGGYFGNTAGAGYAQLAAGDYGVRGFSSNPYAGSGGYFWNTATSSEAFLADPSVGIRAFGVGSGGFFQDIDEFGSATVGVGDLGIDAQGGRAGGYFEDYDGTGVALVGYGNTGIQAQGSAQGGYFFDLSNDAAWVAKGGNGIEAMGWARGGYFRSFVGDASAEAGVQGGYGIRASGTYTAGYFSHPTSFSAAWIAAEEVGVQAQGNSVGAFFSSALGGNALLGYQNRGIWGKGTFAGGTFSHPDEVTYWADVSQISGGTTYKIRGTGTVSFVQNHPYEKDKLVVYAAPEGDEVAVYTRGSARLVGGEARVRLGTTFALVANPDVGLTAHLTPRGESVPLSVASVGTSELVVRGPAGSSAAFDYLVFGLRVGFEEHSPVQIKDREALLPPREAAAGFYAEHPELRALNALERFKDARVARGESRDVDTSRSAALAAAIDANRDAIVAEARARAEIEGAGPVARRRETPEVSRPESGADRIDATRPPDSGTERTPVVAKEQGTWLPVAEPIETGDVLVLDPLRPELSRRAATTAEPNVVGVAIGPSRASAAGGIEAPVAEGRYAVVNVDAGYGAVRPGDLLVASPTPGHAMRIVDAVPGSVVGKAIEGLESGTGTIRVFLAAR